jgi:hypothetical protein
MNYDCSETCCAEVLKSKIKALFGIRCKAITSSLPLPPQHEMKGGRGEGAVSISKNCSSRAQLFRMMVE